MEANHDLFPVLYRYLVMSTVRSYEYCDNIVM